MENQEKLDRLEMELDGFKRMFRDFANTIDKKIDNLLQKES